ncbi:MerR family transcriptional regulator [Roseovarius sp. D0-M9]|uniref:MerR family transcriptional regulator n=1 Tax=Roseovarius sp. D0-M9 TaxID=3127117 RepID=UPI0030105D97
MPKSADAFRTISEVADWLGIPAHVLRFWESKFTQVKPVKRAGGRRYYRPADMQLLGGIRKLLHDEGMTIKGVQKVMREQGVRHVAAMSPPLDADLEAAVADIALNVPEAEEEPRGQVVSFDRSAAPERSGKDEDTAASETAAPDPATPPAPASDSVAREAETTEQTPNIPKVAKDGAEGPPPVEAAPVEAVQSEPGGNQAPAEAKKSDTESPIVQAPADDEAKAQDASPEDAAPEDGAPREIAAKDAAPKDVKAEEVAPEDVTPEDEAPRSDPAAPAPSLERLESAETGGTEAGKPIVIDTPDDPPDTAPAPPSVLKALARIDQPSPQDAAKYAEIAARLADLRQRMGEPRKSS